MTIESLFASSTRHVAIPLIFIIQEIAGAPTVVGVVRKWDNGEFTTTMNDDFDIQRPFTTEIPEDLLQNVKLLAEWTSHYEGKACTTAA